jgi:hypothetical protein
VDVRILQISDPAVEKPVTRPKKNPTDPIILSTLLFFSTQFPVQPYFLRVVEGRCLYRRQSVVTIIINPRNSPRHSAIADANAEASYDANAEASYDTNAETSYDFSAKKC